jgi:hypothetical protein
MSKFFDKIVVKGQTSSTYSSMSIAYAIPTMLSMRSSNTGTLEAIASDVNDRLKNKCDRSWYTIPRVLMSFP